MTGGNFVKFWGNAVFSQCLLWIVLGVVLTAVSGDPSPYKHRWVVDKEGKYVLEWEVDWKADGSGKVTFNVTVETLGWIGLGLSRKGMMNGSDIVVGGVGANGKPYFSDRHGVGNSRPVLDDSQDWTLLNAWESNKHTFLSFTRKLDTCDSKDYPINDDLISIIWAYSEVDDETQYHFQNFGLLDAYILDPDLTPRILAEQRWKNVTTPRQFNRLGDWKVWRINAPQIVPGQDTAYFCTFHKVPTRTKKHIVGVRPVLPTELERRHIHHLGFSRCYAPRGSDINKIFGPHVGRPGQECYILARPTTMPTHYCIELRYEYAIGGGPAFFPDHVGLGMSESVDEYYLLQVHYDNPASIPNLRIDFNLEVYYTDKLRPNDGGLLLTGMTPDHYTNLIPPHTLDHVAYGFCSRQCTSVMFPRGGINVFGTRAHTHQAGRRTRMMVIRGKDRIEEPIYIDENYNYNYQEYRTLRDEVNVKPGDLIYHRCNYQSLNKTRATVGGYATKHEMCHGNLFYFPYIKYHALCTSEIRSDAYREFLQIYNTTFSDARREYIVLAPPINAGLSTEEAATRINWSLDNRRQLQTHQRFLPQISMCPRLDADNMDMIVAGFEAAAATLPPNPNYSPIDPNLLEKLDPGHSTTTFTELDKEIRIPGQEFVHLWPSNVKWYSRPSICPKA